jgi:hypothetical protein
MSTTINGHKMTRAELRVFDEVQKRCEEDKREWFDAIDLYPERNNQDNANRRTFERLAKLGVLAAGEMDIEGAERGVARVRYSKALLDSANFKQMVREEIHAALDDVLDDEIDG